MVGMPDLLHSSLNFRTRFILRTAFTPIEILLKTCAVINSRKTVAVRSVWLDKSHE